MWKKTSREGVKSSKKAKKSLFCTANIVDVVMERQKQFQKDARIERDKQKKINEKTEEK